MRCLAVQKSLRLHLHAVNLPCCHAFVTMRRAGNTIASLALSTQQGSTLSKHVHAACYWQTALIVKQPLCVQDPSYPVYVDTTVMMGNTGSWNEAEQGFDSMAYLPITPANDFFPDLANTPKTGAYPIMAHRTPATACVWALCLITAARPFFQKDIASSPVGAYHDGRV